MGFKDTKLFRDLAKKAYKELDVDKTGRVDYKEVIIGLLKLYDKINQNLPLHVPAPTSKAMMEMCYKFDKDGDGFIDEPEFLELARVLFGTRERWRESLPWIVGSTLALNLVIFPIAASEIVRIIREKDERVHLPTAPVAALLGMVCGFMFKRV